MNRRGFLKGLGVAVLMGAVGVPAVAKPKVVRPRTTRLHPPGVIQGQFLVPEGVKWPEKKIREWKEAVRREIVKWRKDPAHIILIPTDLDREVRVRLDPPVVEDWKGIPVCTLEKNFIPKKEEALYNPTLEVTA
jgi:hypothetical protein